MYKTQLARKLRADDQRNAALKTNDTFTDDDLNIKVRKRDETSKIVPRFTQSPSGKLKSKYLFFNLLDSCFNIIM